MKTMYLFLVIILLVSPVFAQENSTASDNEKNAKINNDSLRNAELDRFWDKLAKTVREGDLEGYASGYHEDAVVVFGTKTSAPIEVALEGWKQGFLDTKAGKATSDVEFRFSQRIGDETTAHETGMFYFTLVNESGKSQKHYAHFEALMVKKDGSWICLMEYQKSPATQQEWESLK